MRTLLTFVKSNANVINTLKYLKRYFLHLYRDSEKKQK